MSDRKKDIASQIIVSVVTQLIIEGIVLGCECVRRRLKVWRCPECSKSEKEK